LPVEIQGRWVFFNARGHPNIRALHRTTFEVTTEDSLTPRGDCIIGVSSELSSADLPEWLKRDARKGALIIVLLMAGGHYDIVIGRGDDRMTFTDSVRMVFRRSDYVGPETVVTRANKAAADLNRMLVKELSAGSDLLVGITAVRVPSKDQAPSHSTGERLAQP